MNKLSYLAAQTRPVPVISRLVQVVLHRGVISDFSWGEQRHVRFIIVKTNGITLHPRNFNKGGANQHKENEKSAI